MFKQIGTILFKLLKSQVKIDFDEKSKIFRLSAPISRRQACSSVLHYVEQRKNFSFKPHQTSFQTNAENQVQLIQEIPLHASNRFREQLLQFWQLAEHCHQMLLEMTFEETLEELKSH
jgi:hypothetical protein